MKRVPTSHLKSINEKIIKIILEKMAYTDRKKGYFKLSLDQNNQQNHNLNVHQPNSKPNATIIKKQINNLRSKTV